MQSSVDGAILCILFKIEDLGINLCKGQLHSPKHINSQWKALSMRQVPVFEGSSLNFFNA